MANERREDWHRGVDENLASLNAGQRIWDRELEKIHRNLAEIDDTIRGDKDNAGLEERLRDLEASVARINAVIFVDSTGERGILHDVSELKKDREGWRLTWRNWTSIAVAAIGSGMLTHFWSDISKAVMQKPTTDPVTQMIQNAEHPRIHHRRYIVHKATPPAPPDDEDK